MSNIWSWNCPTREKTDVTRVFDKSLHFQIWGSGALLKGSRLERARECWALGQCLMTKVVFFVHKAQLTVADSPLDPIDLDILPRNWNPSVDVFPAGLISFSATSWQSTFSLTLLEDTRMWSWKKRRLLDVQAYNWLRGHFKGRTWVHLQQCESLNKSPLAVFYCCF